MLTARTSNTANGGAEMTAMTANSVDERGQRRRRPTQLRMAFHSDSATLTLVMLMPLATTKIKASVAIQQSEAATRTTATSATGSEPAAPGFTRRTAARRDADYRRDFESAKKRAGRRQARACWRARA